MKITRKKIDFRTYRLSAGEDVFVTVQRINLGGGSDTVWVAMAAKGIEVKLNRSYEDTLKAWVKRITWQLSNQP